MLLLIDNYDSFTYNLFHYLGELGAETVVRRNDELDVQAAMALNPAAIVLSPGPCTPNEAGICLALTLAAAETRTPLLGVCLGHQAIGQAFGGHVVRAGEIVHGKIGTIHHARQGRLRRPALAVPRHPLPQPGRRPRDACPTALEVTAGLEDGTIMGLAPPRAARSTACSSTPKSSPPSTAAQLLRQLPRPRPRPSGRHERPRCSP